MRNRLTARIEALEAMPASASASTKMSPEEEAAMVAELEARLRKRIADGKAEQARTATLDAAGRVRHYQAEIDEVEERLAGQGRTSQGCADEISARILDRMRMQARAALRRAQIERLCVLGYDTMKLSENGELPEDARLLLGRGC